MFDSCHRHELVFKGQVRWLRGPRGEEAVMHATANGGDACYYNILRDAKTQSYHQFRYAAPG